jgi:hypothetical protein
MIQQDIEIINKLGLHARASAKLTQLAAKYKSEVWMTRNKRRVNAKSIMGRTRLSTRTAPFWPPAVAPWSTLKSMDRTRKHASMPCSS